MRLAITGAGVVTPLGHDLPEVSRRVAAGERAMRIEGFDILPFCSSDRLRRAPPVSLFAVAAASRALESARLDEAGLTGERVAVIAALSKGAMGYSARFHAQFVRGGAKSVVPLLFPETVANAPASHIAAVFGLHGPNATLLGDAAAAFNAIAMARDFLEWDLADAVLIVAPHEHASIMAEGYARFRWVFKGAPFSEGAAALLLTRTEPRFGEILQCDRGFPFRRRSEIRGCLDQALRGLPAVPTIVSVSRGEALPYPSAERLSVSDALGEAFTAGALWQLLLALMRASEGEYVLATCIGMNEQVSAVLARR